jgi:hypothetical protein
MNQATWWKQKAGRGLKPTGKPKRLPQIEELEARCVLDGTGFRPIDGVGNNVVNPNWGARPTDPIALLRLSPEAYRTAASDPNGFFTPSMNGGAPFFVAGSRLVSNVVSSQAQVLFDPNPANDINTVNGNSLSAFGYTWGQFLDHDMDLTPDTPVNDFPIPSDPTHPDDPLSIDEATEEISLRMGRSVFDPNTGTTSPREQVNVNTAFLDLSQVYGSSLSVAASLRTLSGGKLKTSPGADGVIGNGDDLLPFNNLTYFTAAQIAELNMANDVHLVANTELFAAGDVRANETTELTSLHTLFVRNHNRLAGQVQFLRPSWSDEQVYQTARKINIAQMQFITYTQYLPSLLGPGAMPAYTGYKPNVNPGISTEFSTVAFRFGHSLLNNFVPRHANNGTSVGDLTLFQSFFNPRFLTPGQPGYTDIGAVLKGNADVSAQAMDELAVTSIRNLLFGQDGFGEDLIARDLWRAHDHGIGTYNDLRIAVGLPPITDTGVSGPGEPFRFHGFELISSDPAVVAKLILAYTGPTREAFLANGKHAGDIDPFAAGMAEDHVSGSDLGPLFHRILIDQFTRLRDGDRFYFLNQNWSPLELLLGAQGITLGLMIQTNTTAANLQLNVFKFQASISGRVLLTPDGSGGSGLAGITVVLKDDAGNVLATTVTDSLGRYRFDQLSGPAGDPTDPSGVSSTGRYHISLDLSTRPDLQQVTEDPDPITIDIGFEFVTGVNFGVYFN